MFIRHASTSHDEVGRDSIILHISRSLGFRISKNSVLTSIHIDSEFIRGRNENFFFRQVDAEAFRRGHGHGHNRFWLRFWHRRPLGPRCRLAPRGRCLGLRTGPLNRRRGCKIQILSTCGWAGYERHRVGHRRTAEGDATSRRCSPRSGAGRQGGHPHHGRGSQDQTHSHDRLHALAPVRTGSVPGRGTITCTRSREKSSPIQVDSALSRRLMTAGKNGPS